MSKHTPAPNLIAETFMATFKIFLVIYLATIAFIAIIYFKPSSPRVGDTHVQITQNGNENIHQKINNE